MLLRRIQVNHEGVELRRSEAEGAKKLPLSIPPDSPDTAQEETSDGLDMTGWLWTGPIERSSPEQRS